MAERLHQETWGERRRRLEALLITADVNQQQHDPPQPDNILDPQLYSAAKGRDVDEFIGALEGHCIRERASLPIVLGRRSPLGNTLLHAAAETSDNVRAIIDFVPEHLISCKNSKGETPLHIAARAGIVGAVELLLHRGGLTCTDHNGNSALHEAVRHRRYEVIRKLVNEDPNPLYRQNKESKSPWCVAIETGDIEVLKVLLAVPNDGEDERRLETKDVFGMSPVHVAIMYRNMDMLEEMQKTKSWLFQVRYLEQGTPLHLAAYTNYLDGVKFLMQHYRTNALEQDSTLGYLPIHVACMMGHVKIVNELLRRWSDPAEFLTRLGQNILHVSAQNVCTATVKYILNNPKFNSLINARDLEGNTPLHVAVSHYQPSVLLLARDSKTDLSLINHNNMTALDMIERDIIASDDLISKRFIWAILLSAGAPRSMESVICDPTGQIPLKRLILSRAGTLTEHVSTLLVVATLTASVTFVSGFSVPGGYYGSDTNAGLPALLHKAMYNVFVISNSTAMYSSIMAIVLLLLSIINHPYVKGVAIFLSVMPLWVAITAIPLAFMAGIYGTVTKLYWLSILVLVHGSLALFFFLSIFILLVFPHGCRNPLIRRFSDQITYWILWIGRP
ncbi:protein ACCELERATED CELL DEATH 6 isoform X2 [Eucalyptus grandis]|nr:protein ACCELERATED CELL DEATH 6 isoform X2 [Eucalyptus grandis]